MKFLILTMILAITIGCGKQTKTVTVEGKDGADGKDGYSVVSSSESNPEICGAAGGTMVFLALDINQSLDFDSEDTVQTQYVSCNGRNGSDGQDGEDGEDGQNGQDGENGTNGSDGKDGKDGLNGTSCSVNKVGNSATITCGTSSAVVVDGAKGDKGDTGATGQTGTTGQTGAAGQNASGIYITEIINPCGVEFANDEVFIKLSTGRILALYDGGPHQDRLALIAPGNYITTDAVQNSSCSFTVTSDYRITNEKRN